MPDPQGSSHPVERKIVNSKFSRKRFHISSGISYSTTYNSFKSYVFTFVSHASFYGTHSIRISGANDPDFRSLDSSLKDRHVRCKNLKSKYRYLAVAPVDPIKITQGMNIISLSLSLVGCHGEQ